MTVPYCRAEDIAFASARMDQSLVEAFVDLSAQSSHVHVYDIGEGVEIFVPDMLGDLLAPDESVLPKDEKFQKRILFCRQADGFPAARDGMIGGVQLQVGDLQDFRPELPGASEQGAHPRQQLREGERLAQIVI